MEWVDWGTGPVLTEIDDPDYLGDNLHDLSLKRGSGILDCTRMGQIRGSINPSSWHLQDIIKPGYAEIPHPSGWLEEPEYDFFSENTEELGLNLKIHDSFTDTDIRNKTYGWGYPVTRSAVFGGPDVIEIETSRTQTYRDYNKLPGPIILNQLTKWELDNDITERIGWQEIDNYYEYVNPTSGSGTSLPCQTIMTSNRDRDDEYLRTIKMGGPNIPIGYEDVHLITLDQMQSINIDLSEKNCKSLESETREIVKNLLIWEFIDSKYIAPLTKADINASSRGPPHFMDAKGIYSELSEEIDPTQFEDSFISRENMRDHSTEAESVISRFFSNSVPVADYNQFDGYDITKEDISSMEKMARDFGICWKSFWINKYDPSKVWFCEEDDLTGQPPSAENAGALPDGENEDEWIFQPLDIEGRKLLDNNEINDIINIIKPDPREEVSEYFPNERDGNRWWHDIKGRLAKRTPLFMDDTGHAIISEGYQEPGKLHILKELVGDRTEEEYYRDVKNNVIPDYNKYYPPDHCTLPFSDLPSSMKDNPTSMCPGRAPLTVLQVLNNILPCQLYNTSDNATISGLPQVDKDILNNYIINNGGTFSTDTGSSPPVKIYNSNDACCVCENPNKVSGRGGIEGEVREWKWLPGVWHGQITSTGKEYTDEEKDIIGCDKSDGSTCHEYHYTDCEKIDEIGTPGQPSAERALACEQVPEFCNYDTSSNSCTYNSEFDVSSE